VDEALDVLGTQGRQVPSGRVAADGHPVGVAPELGGVRPRPSGDTERVVEGGGERVLGGEAVVGRDDDALRAGGQIPARGE